MRPLRPVHHVIFVLLMVLLVLFACPKPATAHMNTPDEFLGFKPGADCKLAIHRRTAGYLAQLASQTGRMRVFVMGPTPMGKRMNYAVIFAEGKAILWKEVGARHVQTALHGSDKLTHRPTFHQQKT